LLLGAASVGLAVILAACGSSASATPTATAVTPTASGAGIVAGAGAAAGPTTTAAAGVNRAALQAYRACLTQHGVTLPTRPTLPPNATVPTGGGFGGGGFGGGGFGGGGLQAVIADPANATAVAACKSLLPAGGFPTGGGNRPRGQALQAYYSCLKDNGVAVPTTVAGGPPPSIDRTTPAFTAANQKCQALIPKRTPNSSSTTTSTTVAG
jgi:hypothetical protein